ncbi:MAG: pyridoxal-phosphate dependent enzyme [Ardenticatenaceae bacterium]|nr:pyridoxal-phosphate dependent enzyme [Ardenticatenaceae bacterium]
MSQSLPSPLDPTAVSQAMQRLTGIVNRTPVLTSRTLNGRTACQVFMKCENFQRVGAFKFRGAYNAISQLSEAQKAAGVITHSSGNHAQGLALAAQLLGVKATVVMPEDAPPNKRAATAGYGADIVLCQAIDREKVTADLVQQHGYTLIHPYDNHAIIAGQGTAAWELFDEVGKLDYLFVPVGGGGLISGTALATAARSPHCKVVGVEPAIAADANRSWRDGQIFTLDHVPPTIADGLRTRFIGQRNLPIMQKYVADMTAVSEEAILQTLEFVWSRLKIVIEPSSAVALAPLFTGSYPLQNKRVGVIFSGGNVNVAECGFFQPQAKAAEPAPAAAPSPTPPPIPERPRILVCDPINQAGLDILHEEADLDLRPDISQEALLACIGDYQALVVDRQRRITGQMLEYGFNLRAIACASSRLDHIDVSTARDLGITVFNAPGGNAVAIAEHTMAQLLMLASRFADGRFAGKTLGLIGFGSVGQQVARRAQAFDVQIIVNQPRLTPELAMSAGVQAADLHDLLRQADFVSLHVPFKKETETLIGAAELALMRPTACLIHTGHTELVDDAALLDALENGRLAGAALPALPPNLSEADVPSQTARLRQHPHVIVAPHVTTILGHRQRDAAVHVAHKLTDLLQTRQANESLALELVPIEQVIPHEQIDEKRVARLMDRLEEDGRLVNPPVTIFWQGRYIVLDGATRSTAFKRLGYPHLIVQAVRPEQQDFALHTWYHAISSPHAFTTLAEHLATVEGLLLAPLPTAQIQTAFQQTNALCYFLSRDGSATLAQAAPGADRLAVMNGLVTAYTAWGDVERTLLTDLSRLLAQFPQMTAVAVFPQFQPEDVFNTASQGNLLPAGLTRFVIPGRILRLNADLEQLKSDEPLPAKRAWFNKFLEEKLARSRLRYYQEPVILLDE